MGEPCQPPAAGVTPTYTITLTGFPEVEDNQVITDQNLMFSGDCLVDAVTFEGDQLALSLSCEHPAPSEPDGAKVTITTAAAGLPANVEIGETLSFTASAYYFENIGGDSSGGVFRALGLADLEHYELRDADGPVFAATVNNLGGAFEPITVTREYNCPDWAPCGSDEPAEIRAYVHVSTPEAELDVEVGEVVVIESGELAWDLSLFQARMVLDCHNAERGGFSIVRRP